MVNDDAVLRMGIAETLQQDGFETLEAFNSNEEITLKVDPVSNDPKHLMYKSEAPTR